MMTINASALQGGDSGRTKDFEYVRGEYAIAGELVPYFAITMSIDDALNHLTLASALAVDPDDPVRIDELIQRDVKKVRAEGEIVNYLKEPGRLKFFNSFTVVLMPLDEQKRPVKKFPTAPPGTPEQLEVDSQGFVVTNAGSVRIRQVPSQSFGFLSWVPGSAAAVIIDGQHRFLALDAVNREMNQHLRPSRTRIPVLVLVLDEQAGFKDAGNLPGDVVRASRSIFTDINKYAVKVSAEREYLLDDLSLKAVAMRELVTPGIGKTSAESVNDGDRVPLALIDWAGTRQVKFEDGPFISTIQALHTIVAGLLGKDVSTEPDPTEHQDMVNWVATIYARFEIEDEAWNQPDILERIQLAEAESMPFRLGLDEVRAAARAFAAGAGQGCVQFLLQATPYRALIDKYLNAGFLGTEKEYWLGQGESARQGWIAQFGPLDPAAEVRILHEEVKTAYYYAYLVVFQRAFVLLGNDLRKAKDEVLSSWGRESDDTATDADLLDSWIGRFNAVIAPLLSRDNEEFWLGAAVRTDRRIDYGARGLNSIIGLTKLLLLPLEESKPSPGEDSKLLAGEKNDDVLALLDSDPYRIAKPSEAQLEWVGRWRALHDSIGRGRAPGGELGAQRRSAAKNYRDGLRRHIAAVSDAAGRPLTDEQRDRLVVAFGARRLAMVLEK